MSSPFVAGVTGTNGKTTVVEFTRQLLGAAGRRAATFGSRGVVDADGNVTTGSVGKGRAALPRLCERLAHAGHDAVVIEAFSVALARRLHDELDVGAAAFTNLGRDHLDYHRTRDRYIEAKCRLFDTVLRPDGSAVVLPSSPGAGDVMAACRRTRRTIVRCGPGLDIEAQEPRRTDAGVEVPMTVFGTGVLVELATVHALLVDNALLAMGLAVIAGVEPRVVAGTRLSPPPARLEALGTHRGAEIVLDSGHNPAALEAALSALGGTDGRLIVVLGCGGNRDPGKRRIMGEVAARLADLVIVTDDNPRGEDPDAIRAAVLSGCPDALEIPDRGDAIHTALDQVEPGDRVLLSGKGDEAGQLVAGELLPHSDRETVMEVLLATT